MLFLSWVYLNTAWIRIATTTLFTYGLVLVCEKYFRRKYAANGHVISWERMCLCNNRLEKMISTVYRGNEL